MEHLLRLCASYGWPVVAIRRLPPHAHAVDVTVYHPSGWCKATFALLAATSKATSTWVDVVKTAGGSVPVTGLPILADLKKRQSNPDHVGSPNSFAAWTSVTPPEMTAALDPPSPEACSEWFLRMLQPDDCGDEGDSGAGIVSALSLLASLQASQSGCCLNAYEPLVGIVCRAPLLDTFPVHALPFWAMCVRHLHPDMVTRAMESCRDVLAASLVGLESGFKAAPVSGATDRRFLVEAAAPVSAVVWMWMKQYMDDWCAVNPGCALLECVQTVVPEQPEVAPWSISVNAVKVPADWTLQRTKDAVNACVRLWAVEGYTGVYPVNAVTWVVSMWRDAEYISGATCMQLTIFRDVHGHGFFVEPVRMSGAHFLAAVCMCELGRYFHGGQPSSMEAWARAPRAPPTFDFPHPASDVTEHAFTVEVFTNGSENVKDRLECGMELWVAAKDPVQSARLRAHSELTTFLRSYLGADAALTYPWTIEMETVAMLLAIRLELAGMPRREPLANDRYDDACTRARLLVHAAVT